MGLSRTSHIYFDVLASTLEPRMDACLTRWAWSPSGKDCGERDLICYQDTTPLECSAIVIRHECDRERGLPYAITAVNPSSLIPRPGTHGFSTGGMECGAGTRRSMARVGDSRLGVTSASGGQVASRLYRYYRQHDSLEG